MPELKVLWLTTGYPSADRPNVGVFHQTMAEALARRGVGVTVVAPAPILSRSGSPAPIGSLTERTPGNNVFVYRPRYMALPQQNTLGVAHWLMQYALRRIDFTRYDVIHGHFGYPIGLVIEASKQKQGIPTVLTLHGSDVNVHPELGARQREQFRRAITGADKVIAVSEALARRTFDLTGVKPEVLRTGIHLERFKNRVSKKEARGKLGLPQDIFLVLYVGNFIEAKGIRELLLALSRYANGSVKGVFVGSGPLGSTIRDSRNTVLLGALANEDVTVAMSAADVLVLPSHREGLGTVLVEAGAVGLPVIGTNVGGIPEVVSIETGILIPPRSAEQLFVALEEVRRDYAAALRRAEVLRSFVKAHYDVDRSAERLVAIYEQVLESRTTAHMSKSGSTSP